jgi:hypothetical protein
MCRARYSSGFDAIRQHSIGIAEDTIALVTYSAAMLYIFYIVKLPHHGTVDSRPSYS